MALSTGFDIDKVSAALVARLGWRNPTLEDYAIVSEANQATASGRYYNDGSFHASCTIQNLKETQEDPLISDEDFNLFLEALNKSIAVSTANSVFDKSEQIESGLLYKRYHHVTQPTYVANRGKFVGVKISVGDGDFSVVVDSLSILLDSAVTFNVYIYKDFKNAPLYTIPVTSVANEEVSVSVNKVLNYLSTVNKGGAYYIVYKQADLGSARAIDMQPHQSRFKVFGAESIEAATDETAGFERYDYSTGSNNYGLNLEISTYYEYTDRIAKAVNAGTFDEYMGLSMARAVIEQMVLSPRYNATQIDQSAMNARVYEELNTEPANAPGMPVSPGIKSRLKKELTKLKQHFQQTNKPISVTTC